MLSPAIAAVPFGTNFWYLQGSEPYEGGNPWTGERPFKAGLNWSTLYSYDPATKLSRNSPWSDTFLGELSSYTTFRFMDWGRTNGASITTWSKRTSPTANQYTVGGTGGATDAGNDSGLAYEWMIDLSNRLGKDPWICVPLTADDTYVAELAKLFRDKLKPNLKLYVELHNEFWLQKGISGTSYNTTSYAISQAQAKNLLSGTETSDFDKAIKFYVWRSAQVWKIFRDQFGTTDYNSRVRAIIAGQNANLGVASRVLGGLDNPTLNPSGIIPYAYAVAPYFGSGVDGNRSLDVVFADLDAAVDKAVDALRQNKEKVTTFGRGLKLVTYEGGQHVNSNAAAVNRSWRMNNIYRWRYLPKVDDYVDLFIHYTHVGAYGDTNAWGALEYTGQSPSSSQKFSAILDYIKNG